MHEGLAGANPFAGTVKRTDGKGRSRVPTLAELVEIWEATYVGSDYSAIIRLLILVGMRRNEVGGLRWGMKTARGKLGQPERVIRAPDSGSKGQARS